MPVPLAATGLAFGTITSSTIDFSWTDPNLPQLPVNVYVSPGASVFALAATLLAGVSTYHLANLSHNTPYTVKIGLVDGVNETICTPIATSTSVLSPITTNPTLSYTFDDLILRVAEYLGVADYSGGTAAIPTDAHDLDVCKRCVNDGYARFITDYKWSFLDVEIQIVPNGIDFEFDMPADFQGEFLTNYTYPAAGPVAFCTETTEHHIRALRAGRIVVGYPSLFAHKPKDTVDETTDTARWQVVFWPTPVSSIAVLTGRYRRYPMKLSTGTDRQIGGPQHDNTVKQASLAAAELQRYGQQGPQEALYLTLLAASVKRDVRNVPRSLGYNGDGSDDYRGHGHWPSRANQADSYNGITVGGPT